MRTATELLEHQQNTGSMSVTQPRTTTEPRTSEFTDDERDRTGYFFLRLKNVYPDHYARHYPDESSLKLAKREWAHEIGRFTRQQIDEMFTFAKSERIRGNEDFLWMDIGRIVAIKGTNWQHAMQSRSVDEALGYDPHKLPDLTAKERAREAARREIANMKSMFGAKA